MADKPEKGITTKDTGVFVPPHERVPYSPQYLHMSKAQVLEAERKRKENDLKAKSFRKELETSKAEAPKVETKKQTGRPKKIK